MTDTEKLGKAASLLGKILAGLEHGNIRDVTIVDHGAGEIEMTTLSAKIKSFLIDDCGWVERE